MTDQQILKFAIRKAIEYGWDTLIQEDKYDYYIKSGVYYSIIFSRPFAEAFVNYIVSEDKLNTGENMPIERFLTEMVLETYPLTYLEKFLTEIV